MAAGVALTGRTSFLAFVLGSAAVTAGVGLHLPMFLMARHHGYVMAGMRMDAGMLVGMVLIVAGVCLAAFGLLPRQSAANDAEVIVVVAPEDAPLTAAHWRLMLVLVIALVIDIMKPASLGFTIPGMVKEYGVPRATVSLVPFVALIGTVVGSFVWGMIADTYGRKASILLSAVMFVGTSICGAMPSLAWNVAMCFMMGAAAGGMLPVTYALLAEMMPSRHRGWSLVLVGGLGAVGGYFAASGFSALLQPIFGWRILWLLNLPTGLSLILLGSFIPESAKFLIQQGRRAEAQQVMARFGSRVRAAPAFASPLPSDRHAPLVGRAMIMKLIALSVAGIAWGLINFGLLLWLPTDLVAKGYSMAVSSKLLAESALIAFPTVFAVAFLYSRWSTKWTVVATLGVTIIGLILLLRLELANAGSPVVPVALLIIGSNGLIAALIPFTTESFPLHIRGRSTGWVAACSKLGGVFAQLLSIAAIIPALSVAALATIVPTGLAMAMIAIFGRETRGRDLRAIDRPLTAQAQSQ